jgi:transposase-like protein
MSKLKPKNRYLKNTHLSEAQIKSLIRYFSKDLPASKTAELSGINRNTVNRIYNHVRRLIALYCERQSPLSGEVEMDESYFGPKRVPGKRGRGAGRKTIVFGMLKRGGNVYTQIVPDAQKATLQAIIRGKVSLESVLYTDSWRGYEGLVDVGFDRHLRVRHGQDEFVDPYNTSNHINGIESFWSFTKRRLQKFNGVKSSHFYLFLKESEFRFNHRNSDLSPILLKLLKNSC